MFSKPGRAKIRTNPRETESRAKIRHKSVMLSDLQLQNPTNKNISQFMFPESKEIFSRTKSHISTLTKQLLYLCQWYLDNKCKETFVYLIVIFQYDTISSSD